MKTLAVSGRLFYYFYLTFGIFFFFLGIAFFVPERQGLVQSFFVLAHLFLYVAIAIMLTLLLRLIGRVNLAYYASFLVVAVGFIIFILSLNEVGDARQFSAYFGPFFVISWSHGGASWIRLLVGIGGMALGAGVGAFFLFFSEAHLKKEALINKSKFVGIGIFLLGVAAFLAFILSVFVFYNFWIVLSAEIVTMIGLAFIYKALSL
ncbi:MAG: hypothetical protein Q8P07_04530 [bacterium]|nr:hypothetical protein [bacterium]